MKTQSILMFDWNCLPRHLIYMKFQLSIYRIWKFLNNSKNFNLKSMIFHDPGIWILSIWINVMYNKYIVNLI